MAVEARRGCGYRKVGGLYLVSGGAGNPCDRLPLRVDVCPVCSHGFKQSRGWTWVDVAGLVGGIHVDCKDDTPCPLCMDTANMGKAGLLWIGEKFYKTPSEFVREGYAMGISRRIAAVPRGFKVGETWVLLGHPKAAECPDCWDRLLSESAEPCERCKGTRRLPGIFLVWRPSRIEKICTESQRGTPEVAELIEKGITPVFVPDDDLDHRGSVHDDADAELEALELEASE